MDVPIGGTLIWPGSSAPSDFTLCQGQQFDEVEFAALFAVCGYVYTPIGEQNSGLFRIPDIRGSLVAGTSGTNPYLLGQKGGSATAVITTNEMPAHSHALKANVNSADSYDPDTNQIARQSIGSPPRQSPSEVEFYSGESDPTLTMDSRSIGSSGTGAPFSILNPYISLNFIIRVS